MKNDKRINKRPLKIILICFGITAGVFAAAAGATIFSALSKINEPEVLTQILPKDEVFDTEGNNDFGANVPQVKPDEITWPAGDAPSADVPAENPSTAELPIANTPDDDKKVINLLLIGQDKRPGEKRARSDSIIIASYSKIDGTMKLISLMRDLYVPIPGYSDNRINAAYQFGGMKLLDKTIEKDFGIPIDGNIEVNFEGFTQLVDMLGGLDLKLSTAEATHLNKNGWKLVEGVNHMNGQQTLEYSRIRYVGNADYERTERQRTVLLKIFNNMMQLNVAKKYKMLDKMLPYLTTDMKKDEILSYAYTVLTNGVKSTESHRIPEDGTFKAAKVRKMAVLVPNLVKTRAILKEYIYG